VGRDELRTWLFTPPRQSKVRNELVLRMFLLSALDPADARELLGRIAASTARDAAELRRVRAEAGPVRRRARILGFERVALGPWFLLGGVFPLGFLFWRRNL